MGRKRLKVAKGISHFTPVAVNFSRLEKEFKEDSSDYDPGDEGLEAKRLETNLEYEELVVQVLSNLEDDEKIIFAFQLLRDGGYQIDHGSFAKTLRIGRRKYMKMLREIRIKTNLFIIGYASGSEGIKEKKHKDS